MYGSYLVSYLVLILYSVLLLTFYNRGAPPVCLRITTLLCILLNVHFCTTFHFAAITTAIDTTINSGIAR